MDAKQILVIAVTMLATMVAPASGQQAREPYVRVAEIEIDPSQLEAYKAAAKQQTAPAPHDALVPSSPSRAPAGQPFELQLPPCAAQPGGGVFPHLPSAWL